MDFRVRSRGMEFTEPSQLLGPLGARMITRCLDPEGKAL